MELTNRHTTSPRARALPTRELCQLGNARDRSSSVIPLRGRRDGNNNNTMKCWLGSIMGWIIFVVTLILYPHMRYLDLEIKPKPIFGIGNTSLVIIMGNLRGGEKAWETLHQNVLDANSADLALMIGDEKNTNTSKIFRDESGMRYANSSLLKRAKYVWRFSEYDDWADAVDLINGTGWRSTHLPGFQRKNRAGRFSGLFGGFSGIRGSGAIIFMIRWFLSQLISQDPSILRQYERFVLTRADHYYQCPHLYGLLDLNNHTIWVPQGQNQGGYTDRHLIASREDIIDALDIFPSLLRQPSLFTGSENPERILKKVWDQKKLITKETKRVMFTCATDFDTTRWRVGRGEVPDVPGLLLKYHEEYNLTQNNCQKSDSYQYQNDNSSGVHRPPEMHVKLERKQ